MKMLLRFAARMYAFELSEAMMIFKGTKFPCPRFAKLNCCSGGSGAVTGNGQVSELGCAKVAGVGASALMAKTSRPGGSTPIAWTPSLSAWNIKGRRGTGIEALIV